jgi:phosphoglycolate phosphatase-like HAD superfamily hydrolase
VRLLLFDVDGTLVTARGAGRRALRAAFLEVYGTAGDIEQYDLRGKTDPHIVHDVLTAAGLDPGEIKERLDDFFEAYLRGLARELAGGARVVVLPGVERLVKRLAATEGAVLGLLTGNIEEGARLKLGPTGLWPYFVTGAFGSDHADRRHLPSLAARRAHALTGYPFVPRDVVVIGDTPWDIDCARHFGARAVAVGTGMYGREELLGHAPDLFFDDFADVDRATAALLSP